MSARQRGVALLGLALVLAWGMPALAKGRGGGGGRGWRGGNGRHCPPPVNRRPCNNNRGGNRFNLGLGLMTGLGGGFGWGGGFGGGFGYYGPAMPLTGVNSTHTTIVQQPQPLYLGYGASYYEESAEEVYDDEVIEEERVVSRVRKPVAKRKSSNNAIATNVNNIYIDNSNNGRGADDTRVNRSKSKAPKHPSGVCTKTTCEREKCRAVQDDEDDHECDEECEDDCEDNENDRRCTKHRQCKNKSECIEGSGLNWRRGVQRSRN